MQQAGDFSEVLVSEVGVVIPSEALRAAGIQPGDRVAFVRTSRGSLVVVPARQASESPSLRSVVGIAPRPAGLGPADDHSFLQAIRTGDDGQ